jgi:hypothetical protein
MSILGGLCWWFGHSILADVGPIIAKDDDAAGSSFPDSLKSVLDAQGGPHPAEVQDGEYCGSHADM